MYVCIRYAVTKDMDLSSGGWIEAEMFIPPIGFDVENPNCKTGYDGIIYLEYSINGRIDSNLAYVHTLKRSYINAHVNVIHHTYIHT